MNQLATISRIDIDVLNKLKRNEIPDHITGNEQQGYIPSASILNERLKKAVKNYKQSLTT